MQTTKNKIQPVPEQAIVNHTVFSGEAMQVLVNEIKEASFRAAFADGKRLANLAESQRIWIKLKNEAIKHRKEGREDIAVVLDDLRKWIKGNDD